MIRSALNDQLASIYRRSLDEQAAADATRGEFARRELETILGLGVLLYRNIRLRHLAWYADVQDKHTAYDVEDAASFADEYVEWKEATEHWLARATELDERGSELEHLAEVRQFYEEVKGVNLDVRGLVRRFEELEQGGGIEAGEFFASLRKRESA